MITPNIIVTKRFDTMKRIFFGPKNLGDARFNSLSRALEGIEEDNDLLICAPGRNKNLQEADLNIPPGGEGKGYLNLKFVETRSVLEYFLLDLSPLESNFNTVYNLFDKAKIPLDGMVEKLNKYYISFGSGDNLDEWAGPFECSLGSAQVQLDNNVKSVTLGFIMGSLESIRTYTKKLHGNLGFGAGDKLNSVLPKDSKVTMTSPRLALDQGLDPLKGPLVDPSNLRRRRCLLPPRGWNTYIRKVLKNYLGNIYGDRNRVMIILGDDMDEIFNSGLKKADAAVSFMRNYQGKLKEFGIKLRLRKPNLKNVSQPVASDSSLFSRKVKSNTPTQSFVGGTIVDADTGVESSLDGRYNVDDRRTIQNNKVRDRNILNKAYEEFETYNERQGNSQAIAEKMTQYKDLFDDAFLLTECFLKMSVSMDVEPSLKTPKTILDPIFEFIGGLKKYQKKPSTYALFELNDVEINDLINENTPVPWQRKTSRLVFGDVDLIKKLIYLADEGAKPLTQASYKFTFSDGFLDNIDWENYQKQFKNTILKRERKQTSSFKEKLDFGPFTREFKEIEKQKDLIFMHGVKNSNVQSVSFRKDLAQGALLNFALKARKRSPVLNTFLKLAVVNDNFEVNDVIDYLEDYDIFADDLNTSKFNLLKFIEEGEKNQSEDVKQFKVLLEKSNSRTVGQGLKNSNERFLDFVDLIVGYREILRTLQEGGLEADVPYINDESTDTNTILRRYADLLQKAQSLIIQINIKTLPFFNQKNYFERKSYFFSLYNNLISRSSNEADRIPSTLLNGSYKVRGVRHYLSSEDAFSEFTLVKDGLGNDPILDRTRKILADSAAAINPKKPKRSPSADSPGAKKLPSDGKRQEIAKQLKAKSESEFEEVQIFDGETGEPIPGTVVQ